MTNSATQISTSLVIISLTLDQIEELKKFQHEENYPGAYRYLRSIVNTIPSITNELKENTEQLSTWFSKAAQINGNDGSFSSEFVRGAIKGYGEISGKNITNEKFQEISNKLAESVIKDVIDRNGIPNAEDIIKNDVLSAVNGFGFPPSGWPGTAGDQVWRSLGGLGHDYIQVPPTSQDRERVLYATYSGIMRFISHEKETGIEEYFRVTKIIQDSFDAAIKWVLLRRDPLMLDLDGNGLETIGTSLSHTIYFDTDGNGVKTSVGWVKSDDGFLVLDRNGNGTIDNGTELFGDATPLYKGGKASNGFEALAQEDSNHDGKVDTNDVNWNQLRVWRDLNQDGVSQVNELFTMTQVGIASLNVSVTQFNSTLANGNQITGLGTYNKINGVNGKAGEIGQLADVHLVQDTFHRQFTDTVSVTADVMTLPDLSGTGMVRDLREAASLATPAGTVLKNKLLAYTTATTRAQQMALLDDLISAWGATSAMDTSARTNQTKAHLGGTTGDSQDTAIERFAVANPEQYKKFTALEQFNGRTVLAGWVTTSSTTSDGKNNTVSFSDPQAQLLGQAWDALRLSVYDALLMQTRFKPLLEQIDVVANKNGMAFDLSKLALHFSDELVRDPTNGVIDLFEFNIAGEALFKNTAWQGWSVLTNFFKSNTLTPELKASLDQIRFVFGTTANDTINGSTSFANQILGLEGNDKLKGGAQTDVLVGGSGDDVMDGSLGNDIYVFSKGDGNDIVSDYDTTVGNIDKFIFTDIASTEITSVMRNSNNLKLGYGISDQITISNYFMGDAYRIEQFKFSDGVTWTIADIPTHLMGTAGADTLNAIAGVANTMRGLAGNDILNGQDMADILDGGDGNDLLYGNSGNDILLGGAGDDVLAGSYGADTLTGGIGSDTLDGGFGNDLYVLSKGDGVDIISEYDPTVGNADTITFTDLASTAIVSLMRIGNNLSLVYGATDRLTISNYFYSDAYRIEQFKFSDGVTWSVADMATHFVGTASAEVLNGMAGALNTIRGLAGNDTLNGQDMADILDGGDGNDLLWGDSGNDILLGGAGDDVLAGSYGADTLTGGIGSDTLDGGFGNDLYVLSKGDGIDIISEYDPTVGNVDTITFTDLASTAIISLMRIGNDLSLVYGATDRLTISNYFYSDAYRIEQFKFSDGVTWSATDMATHFVGTASADILNGMVGVANTIRGLAGNDTLNGQDMADILDGGDGNDLLYGNSGNDILLGGAGDDVLSGSYGADTLTGGIGSDTLDGGFGNDLYVLSKGDGVDIISEYDPTVGNVDTITFTDLASTAIVSLMRIGNDLSLVYGATDRLTISNYFYSDAYRIEQFKFSDGVTWSIADIATHFVGTASAEVLNGMTGVANAIRGLAGNDTLNGQDMADILDGGDGNDNLYGNSGNDILLGGAGDDVLAGSYGADTLTGGIGNDILDGGVGNDLYVLSKGDGIDLITDYDPAVGNIDTITFTDLASTAIVSLMRVGNDLSLVYGATDRLTISNYFAANACRIEQFKFSDDVTWSVADMATHFVGTASADVLSGMAGVLNTIRGLAGNDTLNGQDMADILDGGDGNDLLYGNGGNDILLGGAGFDTLTDTVGNNLFAGGANDDVLTGGAGNEFFIGGTGNDNITTGTGYDILAFNRGDGQDSIAASSGDKNSISLGHGILYRDLSLSKTNNDLVLVTGSGEQITFKDWYPNVNYRSVSTLQMVIEGSSDYSPSSSSAMNNSKIEQFNFDGLVTAFDQARGANASLSSWALSGSLLKFHLGGSDTTAVGGDLAYQYAKNGEMTNISATPAQALLANPQFGISNQKLQFASALQDASFRLA